MPRKGKTNVSGINNNVSNGNSGKGGRNEWKWVNLKLSDEDIDTLAKSDATLEYLACCGVALANDGIGFKVEPTDEGKSIRCTIYRPNFNGRGDIIGISSYSDNVRDAILAGLYKLDNYMGGDFSTYSPEDAIESATPRFR